MIIPAPVMTANTTEVTVSLSEAQLARLAEAVGANDGVMSFSKAMQMTPMLDRLALWAGVFAYLFILALVLYFLFCRGNSNNSNGATVQVNGARSRKRILSGPHMRALRRMLSRGLRRLATLLHLRRAESGTTEHEQARAANSDLVANIC